MRRPVSARRADLSSGELPVRVTPARVIAQAELAD
jgi:hypothetical protein